MPSSEPILITGATGFVGSHFTYKHLRRGGSGVAVVRGRTVADARTRLLRVLEDVAVSHGEPHLTADAHGRLQVVLGDVTLPHCGIDSGALLALAGRVSSLWHFAASLAYEQSAAEGIARHNIGGVGNAISLARHVSARRFVHVSTAYTAGRRVGRIPEELHPESTVFNNHYERTKAEAERLVVSAFSGTATDYRIVRPSIVIGPSKTHQAGGSDTGIYGIIRELRRARRALNLGTAIHRVAGNPDIDVNMIPVDHVVHAMLRVEAGERPHQKILHVTNPKGPRLGDAIALGCTLSGIRPIVLVPDHKPTTTIERTLSKRFEFYSYYFRDEKTFVRSIPSELRLSSTAELRPYVESALSAKSPTLASATPPADLALAAS